jgi:hypothetical protein
MDNKKTWIADHAFFVKCPKTNYFFSSPKPTDEYSGERGIEPPQALKWEHWRRVIQRFIRLSRVAS